MVVDWGSIIQLRANKALVQLEEKFAVTSQTRVGEVFEYIDCINAFEGFYGLEWERCLSTLIVLMHLALRVFMGKIQVSFWSKVRQRNL